MRTNQAARSTPNLVDKPERVGPALAQVLRLDESGREHILGQAWLAAPNRMVTCGHVVEPFLQQPQSISVLFPTTGRRYPVLEVRLHPSFVRQPDGLVKFDVALLSVQLGPPDSNAQPLPFSYEQGLRINQRVWTIRFPAHLGQFSAAVQPLSQDGQYLGLLRKHDSFHLLHDLPLAPGDSGAPICDARGIVAIHCGDTATIPGLNLPTTSIRLALWVDALRELGLAETRKTYINRASRLATVAAAFFVMFGIAFGAGHMLLRKPPQQPATISEPAMTPLGIAFNKPPDKYGKDQPIQITLEPTVPVYPFLLVAKDGALVPLFPAKGEATKMTETTLIDQNSTFEPLTAPKAEAVKLYVLAAKADDPASEQFAKDFHPLQGLNGPNPALMKEEAFLNLVKDFEKDHPDLVTLTEFNIPPGK